MADNVSINTGSTINIAAESVVVSGATTLLQRIKLALGTYDVDDGDVSTTNPMPVTGSTTILSMPAITGSVTVIGTLPSITGSVTVIGTLPSVTGSVSVINTPTITGSVTVIGTPSITGSVTVLGTVTVNTNSTITVLPAITGSVTVIGNVTVTTNSTITVLPAITGSVTVVGALPAVTGSVTVVGTLPSITGSVTVVGTLPSVTGSVTVVGALPTATITGSTTITQYVFPSAGIGSINPSTAGTSIIIPSTATNSIYVTDLVISNGLTAGTIYLGYGKVATAPTTTAIYIQPFYFAANGGMVWPIVNPIKLPSSTCFICTVASAGSISITATYYVAP